MLGSTIVEVGIGLVFIYFLLSVICTTINDFISQMLNWRSQSLREGVRNLLGDDQVMSKVWNHSLVQGMTGRAGAEPTYIPSNTFALALFDVMAPAEGQPSGLDKVRSAALKMPDNSARQALVSFVDAADSKMDAARKNVADWFDAAMYQVSAAYKQKMQVLAFVTALIITTLLGVDTLAIANTLYREPAVRAAVANAAQASQASTQVSGDVKQNVQAAVQSLEVLGIPLGWGKLPADFLGWASRFAGILLTAAAASFGSPFWYDLLRNLLGLVKSPQAKSS
jgi:hypothetical protein